VLTQCERIKLLDLRTQLALSILGQDSRGQQTLQRRLGDIIHPMHPFTLVDFGLELHGGLKAIDHQAECPVNLAELLKRLHPYESHTANRLAYHGSVLLLDMALIVFDPWAPAREGQLFLFTIAYYLRIEELGAAIGVNTE
jgi:hypothetical protein